jgi:Cu2+-exporting ATPase
MSYRVAHAVRGRLRVRYAATWLTPRREVVEATLRALPGVRAVSASGVTGSLRIEYDPFRLAERSLLERLEELSGVTVPRTERRSPRPGSTSAADGHGFPRDGTLPPSQRGSTVPLLQVLGKTSVLAATFLPLPAVVLGPLVLVAELPTLLRAVSALGRRRVNGDVLEASTLVLLAARGNYAASALLASLRAVGEFVVARNVQTARRSLHELVIPPERLVRRVSGTPRTTRVASLTRGEVVVVEGGEQVPADGTVVRGEALVNQQTMTGEALPVERGAGDQVFALTTVEHGEIEVRVERTGLDTAVGHIVQAIATATGETSRIQLFAERLADREVSRTLLLAVLGATFSRSVDAGTAILVADYGMAARVGIPTALVTSIRRAVGEGILIKGPRVLETLARVDTVVFDKTGTLTTGTPRVSQVVTYDAVRDQRELVRLVAAAERGFRHPIARAVARLAREWRLEAPTATSTLETTGLGVDVRIAGHRVQVGSRRFMESHEILLSRAAGDEADAHAAGASPTFVAVDGRLAGLLTLEDQLRAEAPAAVAALRARRMRNVIMLTGDHPQATRVIAERLGVRHYYPELLPEDKARLIRELKAEDRVIAMVGDGVNDALALREADVGIAVPGGAAVTAEAAGIVLLEGGLEQVVRTLDLAGDAIGAIRRTLSIAAQANLAVVGLASLGFASPITSILLSHGSAVFAALALALFPKSVSPGGVEHAA